jgi:hypothetical protein
MKTLNNRFVKIPLLVAILTAVVYLILFLVNDKIPISGNLLKNSEFSIPIYISRLWDILFSAIYAFILLLFFESFSKIKKSSLFRGHFIMGILTGCFSTMAFSNILNDPKFFSFFLILALLVPFLIAFGALAIYISPRRGLDLGITFVLGMGLGTGIIGGILFGFGPGLTIALFFIILAIISHLIKELFFQKFWRSLSNFLKE